MPEELQFSVSSNILKQIVSTSNAACLRFILVDNGLVILNIRDRKDGLSAFNFIINAIE